MNGNCAVSEIYDDLSYVSLQGVLLKLYHGSRALFDSFDPQFFGSGEGSGLAFWFIDDFDGAAYHARKTKRHSAYIPRVYTCEFPDHLPVADLDASLSSQPHLLECLRDTLPVELAFKISATDRNWGRSLLSIWSEFTEIPKDNNDLIELLSARCGIMGAHNLQGGCGNNRYKGRCTVIFAGAEHHIRILKTEEV